MQYSLNHMTDSCNIHWCTFCTVFDIFPEGLRPLRVLPYQRIFPVALSLRFWSKRGRVCCFSTLPLIVAETASVSFSALSFCSPLIVLLPFNADRFPFTSFHRSNFNSFDSGLKVSCSDLLIPESMAVTDVAQFLVLMVPVRFWVDQAHGCASCTNFNSLMSGCHTEFIIDHGSDLSSAKESVIELSLLLGQIDSFLEVWILDDVLQEGCDLRIHHFKIREIALIDCDVSRSSSALKLVFLN